MQRKTFMGLVCSLCVILWGATGHDLQGADDVPALVPAPAAGVTLVPEMIPTTSEDIGRRFVKVENSSAVASVKLAADGKKFIYLPVNFKEGPHRRVAWDIKVKGDWSEASSISFDFIAGKTQDVGGLFVYFHSVDGWYTAAFGLDVNEGWTHIEISKGAASIEGIPRGWSKIDTIRISTWRQSEAQDGWFGLANFGVRNVGDEDAQVLVIRGDSCMERYPAERKAFPKYAGTLVSTLEHCGIGAVLLSDREITADVLKRYRVVMLPYNPSVPPETVAALEGFVAAGGKVVGFYIMPQSISKLLGVTYAKRGWVSPPQGSFGGFLATSQALKHQPRLVVQDSFCTMVPQSGIGRIIATWANPDGSDTRLPAIVMLPRGAYIGHVWLSGSGTDRDLLMESLLSEYMSIDRVSRLRKQLENLGRQDVRGDWASLEAQVKTSGRAEAVRSLAEAATLRDRAEALLKQGDWEKATPLVVQAREAAKRAFFLTLRSSRGEERLFWCHNAAGIAGWSWDRAAKYLADSGFTAVIPNMCWGGCAYYDSKVLPRYAGFAKHGDYVKECLEACKKYGLKCHVWKVCFNAGHHGSKAFCEKMAKEGRVQVSRQGKANTSWLCPTHPLNQQLEIDTMVELVRNYPTLDGIHFDYIRFSNPDVCFCAGCRERFEAYLGRKLKVWPFPAGNQNLTKQWHEFRRQAITHVVKTVHDRTKAIRPTIKISAAVFPNCPIDRDGYGQDWELWCKNGWLDFVCPMDYREDDLSFRSLVRAQKQWNHGVPLYPGIGISCWKDPNAFRFARQIELVRQLGLKGFTVFNYDSKVLRPMGWLKLGCTRDK